MRVFLDTGVLVATVVAKHEFHAKAFRILERVQDGIREGLIAAHSLAEMYALLTKLLPPFHHSPEQALIGGKE